ncbi:MAG: S-methyl-5-thioribose-1-phosphate isomerase [Xanthomonadales bacterium]|nr:S-methyl-5-thioribose-1-phosphate isomerase [Xanthomonadales bacterium]
MSEVQAIRWSDQGHLELLDQRKLPSQETYLTLESPEQVAEAIRDLVVRGAPAIGITAAYGMVLAALRNRDRSDWREGMEAAERVLGAARPTAVNLAWALKELRSAWADTRELDPEALLATARQIHRDDIEANRRIGQLGATLIAPESSVLTHCNTGALATGGYGTALGVIRSAFAEGKLARVFASETRPWLQGARLTAWELLAEKIPVELVVEGAVAPLFRSGMAQWLIVGADRIVANGDVANKIGTYSAALHAHTHGAKVMVAAPASTVDLSIPDGSAIPIEHRSATEILSLGEVTTAASGSGAWNPVFDVTPAKLIDAIVTQHGIARPPYEESLPKIV